MVSQRGERKTRVTSDDAQGTMGKVKKGGLAPSRPFSPSRLPLRANFHRERETSGDGAGSHLFYKKTKIVRAF